ncbi:D(1) dopamine receptor [Petromyzon marinus]|uniref:D(1) dopamine receptor n=1 Tax=Petromyzon marinus TaxID=7757 RepID=UPI003F6EC93D
MLMVVVAMMEEKGFKAEPACAAGNEDEDDTRRVMLNLTADEALGCEPGKGLSFRILAGCLLSLLILSTLFGNTLVCAAVIKFRHLRSKVTNYFVISLAVSDLFVALLVMPWKAITEVAGFWPFGAFCNVWVAFDIMCSTASILNLCVISVDRYWAISSPFRYERKMTQRVAFVMISVAWTLSVLISFIPVQLNWHKAQHVQQTWEFHNASGGADADASVPENCDSSLNRTYAISSSLISFYIPVAIMIVTYTKIYRIAQRQIRRIASLERAAEHAHNCQLNPNDCPNEMSFKTSFKKETKVLKTLSVIMGVFVFCWLPFFILNCVVPFCDSAGVEGDDEQQQQHHPLCVSETTFSIFVWFGWANSSLNPIIYAFNADFRKAFSTLLGCNTLCASTPVETVNLSNEVASYPHDVTSNHKDGGANYVQFIPHVVIVNDESDGDFDKVPEESRSMREDRSGIDHRLDCDEDVSLETITPFTPNGVHET